MIKNLIFLITLSLSTSAFSHGYILNSRTKLCSQGVNHDCGAVIYEAQSVEGPDRFPLTGPADGTIAAAGSPRWTELNEQTPSRWHKVDMQPGNNIFNWHFTANHITKDWRYFITKQDWDPAQPLTRESFDLNPFCSYSGDFQHPAFDISHSCDVPDRSGYQIILGVWDVGDTSAGFYNVIDIKMPEGDTLPPLAEKKDVGDINPSSDLKVGDVVRVRLFTLDGELTDQAIEMTISSDLAGKRNPWPKLLAEYINSLNTELEAGIKDTQGNIVPVFGKNEVFVGISSVITRIEIDIDLAAVEASLEVDLQQSVFSIDEPMHLVFDAIANPAMGIMAELFYQGARIGYQELPVLISAQVQFDIEDPHAGSYQLIVRGETADHQHTVQKSFTVSVVDSAGFIYPDNIGSYTQGDLIRGQDGNTYQCLITGWCNGSMTYYAPGLGLAWGSAWEFVAEGATPLAKADFSYPDGQGQYQSGTIVKGTDNNLYRCNITAWCNSPSSLYYAPGTGLAWDSAWTSL